MNATSEWIPTSERLPENEKWVVIWLDSGRACVGRFVPKNNSWRTSDMTGPLSIKNVRYWAELIKPADGEREQRIVTRLMFVLAIVSVAACVFFWWVGK